MLALTLKQAVSFSSITIKSTGISMFFEYDKKAGEVGSTSSSKLTAEEEAPQTATLKQMQEENAIERAYYC